MLKKLKKTVKKSLLNRLLIHNNVPEFPYRRYFNIHSCIFIHIPKTAGSSILAAISDNDYYRDHCDYSVYLRASPERFRQYLKFCFVRNPFDRLVSTFRYLASGGNQMDDLTFKSQFDQQGIGFERFVLDFLNQDNIYAHTLFKPQHHYIFNFNHEVMVDYIGRYENLTEGYTEVMQRLGVTSALPTINRTPGQRTSLKEYYSKPEVIDKVLQLYRLDFELLGYDKYL